jgi:hypothetical protein
VLSLDELVLGAAVSVEEGGVVEGGTYVVVVVSPDITTDVMSIVSVDDGAAAEVEPGKEGKTAVVDIPSVRTIVVEPCAVMRVLNAAVARRRIWKGAIVTSWVGN